MNRTPMYLTTVPNGACACLIETPRTLSDNVYLDPTGEEILSNFLLSIGVNVNNMPDDRWQAPPTDGEGIIVIVTRRSDGKFDLAVWQLLPAGENPMMHGSPLMPA